MSPKGKERAQGVLVLCASHPARRNQHKPRAQWGAASYFAILLFLLVFAVAAIVWHVPRWVALAYLVASAACFIAYAIDKAAAAAGRRRISENTLIFFGLVGGWPGAIVAQQLLRHKTVKAEFRSVFWVSVLLNVALFIGLSSSSISWLYT